MNKINFRYIILFILFFKSSFLFAQEKGLIFSKYYSPTDYNAGTQNWCIAEDNRGVLYFGNGAGVLEYDGETWRHIDIPNYASVRSLAFDSNNILYACSYGQIGYISPDLTGNMSYNSLNHLIDSIHIDFGEVWDVSCISDTVFFLSDKYIFRYHNNKFDYLESESDRFYLSHKLGKSILFQEMGKGLMKIDKDSLVLIDKGDFFADKRIHSILPYNDDLLICTRTKGFFIYIKTDTKAEIKSFSQISSKTKDLNKYFIDNVFYHGIEISDSLLALSTITGNIIIADKKWNIVDIINDETIGIKSSIHFLHHQKNQSLWIALGNGICQVEVLSPYRYWNDDNGIHGTLSDVAQHKDNFYVSTGSGVYVTNSKNTSKFELNSFKPIEGNFEQAWRFLYYQPPSLIKNNPLFDDTGHFNYISTDKTVLLVSSSNGLFQINGTKSKLISDYKSIYLSYQYKKDPNILFLGLDQGIAMLSYDNGKWKNQGLKFNIPYMIKSINEDTLGNLWLCADYKGVYKIGNPLSNKLEENNIEFYDTTNNLPSINGIRIFNYKDTLIFYNSYKDFRFNPKNTKFEPILYQEDTTENNEAPDTLSYYRIYEERISGYYVSELYPTKSWFGSTYGTCKHQYVNNRDLINISPTIVRKVIVNDSSIYNGTNYKKTKDSDEISGINLILNSDPIVNIGNILKYKDNSLTFFFASPYFEKESKNKYSFYLKGFDKDWSAWTTENKKEYTNLREGDYTFKVKSINLYQIETPIAEFKFTVLPPWYRTFSAFIGYSVFGVLIIILIVKLYTYRLIREKDKLEKIVIERTQEILMQKEEILVQAEHLKDANEEIVSRNEELETQRDKLEISNATKNKFFRIIAHDLRNPISTLAGSTNLIFNAFDDYKREQTKVFIGELNKLSQTTFNLLENLLDWSSTQMGQIKYIPKSIDIKSLTAENLELIKPKIDSKNITLVVDIEDKTIAFADENMVKTIIRNLLSNAVKFTPEEGKIELACKLEGDILRYSVKDSGIGIKEKDLKKLFRIDTHHTTPGLSNEKGSGLGLILCKEFVEKNEGEIFITSTPDKGTSIEFTLKNHIS